MTTSPYTKENMLARQQELLVQIQAIEARSPRQERDDLWETLTIAQAQAYRERIIAAEEGLFELRQEYATLAKLLGARRA